MRFPRFPIALLAATFFAVMLNVVREQNTTGLQPLRTVEEVKSSTSDGVEIKYPPAVVATRDNPQAEGELALGWLWQAFSKVLLFVLFGWAMTKLYLQFRVLIMLFLGLIIIAIFLLNTSGLVSIEFHPQQLERVFYFFRTIIMDMHLTDFLAVLVGLWAGYASNSSTPKQQTSMG